MTYRTEHMNLGWVVVVDGHAGPKTLTDTLPASVACEVVDLLKGRYRDVTHAHSLAIALQIDPKLSIPSYLSSLLVEAARLLKDAPCPSSL